MRTAIRFNPADPAFVADPYRTYRELRENDPVHYEPALPGWLISRYDDVSALMGDPRLINVPREVYFRVGYDGRAHADTYVDMVSKFLLFANPPSHTRVRRAFSAAFTPAALERTREDVRRNTEAFLDQLSTRSRADIVTDFAGGLATMNILSMLGLPADDYAYIQQIVTRGVLGAFELLHGTSPMTGVGDAVEALPKLIDYIVGVVRDRRNAQGDDPLTQMSAAVDKPDSITMMEFCSNISLLFILTITKATNHFALAVHSLLENPDQMRDLAAHPEIAESASDELMRYQSPVQISVPQRVAEGFTVRGVQIERGQFVYLLLGSANRDPERFPDPDRLDLRRPAGRHIGFGVGLHGCLGAAFARIQSQEVLPRLIRRFPQMKLDSTEASPRFRRVAVARSLENLPVILR